MSEFVFFNPWSMLIAFHKRKNNLPMWNVCCEILFVEGIIFEFIFLVWLMVSFFLNYVSQEFEDFPPIPLPWSFF